MTITPQAIETFRKTLGEIRVLVNERIVIGHHEFEPELYAEAVTVDELVHVVRTARTLDIPFHILGLGFSPDQTEIEGLVIKNNCRKFDILSVKGKIQEGHTETEYVFVIAETGVGLNQLVRYTIEEGLGGLESYLGISGTVGDALMQQTEEKKKDDYLTSHIFTLRFLSKENEVIEVNAEPFLYPLEDNMIRKAHALPLSVVFKLKPSDKKDLWKKATQAAFERNQSELLDPLKGNFTL